MRNAVVALALTAAALPAQALQVSIRDAAGAPLPLAMVFWSLKSTWAPR